MRQKGFTLIELMVVIAIIAILAAIAIAAYKTYIARSQLAEALTLAESQKNRVAEAYFEGGTFTGVDNGTNRIPPANEIKGKYVKEVVVSNGVISALMRGQGHAAAGVFDKRIVLQAIDCGSALGWRCVSDAEDTYLPGACSNDTIPSSSRAASSPAECDALLTQ